MIGIAYRFIRELHHSAHDVVKADGVLGNRKPNGRRLATVATTFGLGRIETTALARIHRRAMLRHGRLTLALQFFLRAETQVSLSLFYQPLGMLAIDVQPIALTIRRKGATKIGTFLPIDAEPLQVFEKLVFVAGFATLEIGVFDAQDHGALRFAGEQPVIECGAGVAHVQLPSGRRREADAYFGIFVHTLMLARARRLGTVRREYKRRSLDRSWR